MEDSQEYDMLLRSIFDACDSAGTGLLPPAEFEQLCRQLQLENEHRALYAHLFHNRSAISYDNFKESLLALLAGTLPPPTTTTREGGKLFDPDAADCNDNVIGPHSNGKTKRRSAFDGSDRTIADLRNDDDDARKQRRVSRVSVDGRSHHHHHHHRSSTTKSVTTLNAGNKYKSYGRKSRVEKEAANHNAPEMKESGGNVRQSRAGSRSSRIVIPPHSAAATIEVLTAEGEGSHWINPDKQMAPPAAAASDEHAQDALGEVWVQVIGDLQRKIDVDQLQKLYQALQLTSSISDVQQLFELLDSDLDGLVSFDDFVRQMSLCAPSRQKLDDRPTTNNKRAESDRADPGRQSIVTSHPARESIVTSQPARESIMTSSTRKLPDVDSALAGSRQSVANDVGNRRSMTSSHQNNVTSSHDRSTASSNTSFLLSSPSIHDATIFTSSMEQSRDSDDNSYDVRRMYDGAPPAYHRRRRVANNRHNTSTSSSTSSSKRRHRHVPLPHHHPLTRQRVQELPLYYLTGEYGGRYVEVDRLKSIWKEEGIEECDEILSQLGVNLDDSFSIEAFSESMDVELSDNKLHQAVCALYKNGIKFYRSKMEEDTSDRNKLQSKIIHLTDQIHEKEEVLERMEEDNDARLRESEERSKAEIGRLTEHIDAMRKQSSVNSEKETKVLKDEISKLIEIERNLTAEVTFLRQECKRLESECEVMEKECSVARSNVEKMKVDFEHVCRGMVTCSTSQLEQQSRMEQLVAEYHRASNKFKDENDELLAKLEHFKRHWWRDKPSLGPDLAGGSGGGTPVAPQQPRPFPIGSNTSMPDGRVVTDSNHLLMTSASAATMTFGWVAPPGEARTTSLCDVNDLSRRHLLPPQNSLFNELKASSATASSS